MSQGIGSPKERERDGETTKWWSSLNTHSYRLRNLSMPKSDGIEEEWNLNKRNVTGGLVKDWCFVSGYVRNKTRIIK